MRVPRLLSTSLSLLCFGAAAFGAAPQNDVQGPAEGPLDSSPGISLALVGGVVHTMVPGEEPATQTILLAGDRIVAVGPDLALPQGVEVLELSGRHIVPGLIDAMVGFDPDHDALYLRAGVTLVRDIGSARVRNLALRETQARDAAPGPALLTPGAPLDGDPPSTPEAAILRDVSAAEVLLPIVLSDGPDYLSTLRGLSPDVFGTVLSFAAEHDLDVWGPVPLALLTEEALELGQRGFTFLDSLLAPGMTWDDLGPVASGALAQALGSAGARLVPALEASSLRLTDPRQAQGALDALGLLAPSYAQWWNQEAETRVPRLTPEVLAEGRRQVAAATEFFLAAHRSGVQLVPGSGAPNPWLLPGNSLHAELARWVEAGLAPDVVLDLATRGAAEALGQGQIRGRVQPGFVADLVVVEGDPRQDLGVLVDPELVVLRGRALAREELEEALRGVLEARNAERSLLHAPIPVDEPPVSDGAQVVLSGHVENWAVGQRVAAERFHVERFPDGLTRYVARIVEPARQGIGAREMLVRQDVRAGRLVEFTVVASDGQHQLKVEGIWTAETMRIRRLYDGILQDGVMTTGERIVTLDAGTVTSFLILAQKPRVGTFSVLTLHEGLTPELVHWELAITPDGDFQVGTPTGPLAFRLDERGAPTRSRRVIGRGTLDGNLLEADTRGGPGHVLPRATRDWVTEQAGLAKERSGGDGQSEKADRIHRPTPSESDSDPAPGSRDSSHRDG